MNGHLAVIALIRASGTVGEYIGGSGLTTARVFPGEAHQGSVYPLIRVDVFDGEAFDTKSGPAYIDHDIVKVFCDAEDETSAAMMAKAVRVAIEEQSGTFNGIEIEIIRHLTENTYSAGLTNKVVRTHECDYQVRVVVN